METAELLAVAQGSTTAHARHTRGAVQLRIAHMWDSVTRGAADLQEQLADSEGTPQAEAQARWVLAALDAAVETLEAVMG